MMLIYWEKKHIKYLKKRFNSSLKRGKFCSKHKKIKYMVKSCEHNMGQNYNNRMNKKSFEEVPKFKNLGKIPTKEYCICTEFKCRCLLTLISQFLSSSLLSKIYIKITRTTFLPIVFHGCLTSSLTLWDEHWTRMFTNKAWRETFGPI